MVSFKQVKYVGNLTGEVKAETDWTPAALHNAVQLRSSNGKVLHAYCTERGLLIYGPEKQVAILWDDLLPLVETVAPVLKGEPPQASKVPNVEKS